MKTNKYQNNGIHEDAPSAREEEIKREYGELITTRQIAQIFCYPSEAAVLKAHARGTLPISMGQFRGRRGWFATAHAVAVCLESFEDRCRSGGYDELAN